MAAHSLKSDSDMSINHKKPSELLPAPVLPVAYGDNVFLEDVIAGARVDIELNRNVYPGTQVTLEYKVGNTSNRLVIPLQEGRASFLIPPCAFINSLWVGGMQMRYWVDDPLHKSEVLDLGVSMRW